jgi:hypothetical protein
MSGNVHTDGTVEPLTGPQTPSGVSNAHRLSADPWISTDVRRLILAQRKSVRLDRDLLLQILATADAPGDVIRSLVDLFDGDVPGGL